MKCFKCGKDYERESPMPYYKGTGYCTDECYKSRTCSNCKKDYTLTPRVTYETALFCCKECYDEFYKKVDLEKKDYIYGPYGRLGS